MVASDMTSSGQIQIAHEREPVSALVLDLLIGQIAD
jgi:hypothetical protein